MWGSLQGGSKCAPDVVANSRPVKAGERGKGWKKLLSARLLRKASSSKFSGSSAVLPFAETNISSFSMF